MWAAKLPNFDDVTAGALQWLGTGYKFSAVVTLISRGLPILEDTTLINSAAVLLEASQFLQQIFSVLSAP